MFGLASKCTLYNCKMVNRVVLFYFKAYSNVEYFCTWFEWALHIYCG